MNLKDVFPLSRQESSQHDTVDGAPDPAYGPKESSDDQSSSDYGSGTGSCT